MHLQRCSSRKGKRQYSYWRLVESYRSERGPRQRVVAYLGDLDEAAREGIKSAATHLNGARSVHQKELFEDNEPEWIEVDVNRVRVEDMREFGAPWLGLEMMRKLGLPEFLQSIMPQGKEAVEWANMALVLILARLCHPSSELHIAEHYYEQSGLSDLLGIPAHRVNDDRLYRALDQLLPHKEALESHLKERLGQLFELEYDLLLYDMTSTFFEGSCSRNPQAQRGYSRDQRGDCKQVTIALVVTRDGMPLGYQVFDGNRADVTTVQAVVERIEKLYGRAERIWVMDRGMVSQSNVEWLRAGGRRYILGTPKSMLKKFDKELLAQDWTTIKEGLEVKLCFAPEPAPEDDLTTELTGGGAGQEAASSSGPVIGGIGGTGGTDSEAADSDREVFILCRSADRHQKEKAMHDLFIKKIEDGLVKIAKACERGKQDAGAIERRIGRLLANNTRAEDLFDIVVETDGAGAVQVRWTKKIKQLDWSRLRDGCYLLRSNITGWNAEDLWKAYIQLTQAETAFRIHKQDLSLRPVWHQRADRVQAHILVCFLAYVVWKTLAMVCHQSGLGDDPRKVIQEFKKIGTVDVVMPTRSGIELRRRYIAQPDKHLSILLHQLNLQLPKSLGVRPKPYEGPVT